MKKLVPILLLAVAGAFCFPAVRDEALWLRARLLDSPSSYEDYLMIRPNGRHADEARERFDDRAWERAEAGGGIVDFESYLKRHQDGRHAAAAWDRIDEIWWRDARDAGTAERYETYLRKQPAGKHVAEARERVDDLRWAEASAAKTTAAYERYLRLQPQGRHTVEAKEAMDEIAWGRAVRAHHAMAYHDYIIERPDGRHAEEARRAIDELAWQHAKAQNSRRAYDQYLSAQPQGAHVAEARATIDDLEWAEKSAQGNFGWYLRTFPDGRHAAEARAGQDQQDWAAATNRGTIKAFRDYVAARPQGRFVSDAAAREAALRVDPAPFRDMLRVAEPYQLDIRLSLFASNYPGHVNIPDAARIATVRDLTDLLAEGKVEADVSGRSIQGVDVRVKNRSADPIRVRIPPGTFFIAANPAAQNMVAVDESSRWVLPGATETFGVLAACANRPRNVPGSADTFSIQRSSHQEELARLAAVLDKAAESTGTRQAAVWIVTDDASYEEMGVLVSRPAFMVTGGTRSIGEREAARAMQLCGEAGINIRAKRIWLDRPVILRGLPEGDLKNWLAGQ